MPIFNLFSKTSSLSGQKKKLHAKTMSMDAFNIMLDRFTFNFPDIRFEVDFTIDISSLMALFYSIVFGINLSQLEIPGFQFDLEIPELSELLQLDFCSLLSEEFIDICLQTGIKKGVYGETQYEYSYYDPEFQMKHVFALLLKTIVGKSYDQKIDKLLSPIFRTEWLPRYLKYFEKIAHALVKNAMFLGVNLLGLSIFPEQTTIDNIKVAKVPVTEDITLYVSTIDQGLAGFILGITPLSFGRFTPKLKSTLSQEAKMIPYYRMRANMSRFMPHYSAYKLVEREEGAYDVFRSTRAERYGAIRSIIKMIRPKIYRILEGLENDPIRRNAYVSAVAELITVYYKPHSYLRKYKSDLSLDAVKKVWLNKWEKFGLNRDILNMLYERFETTCLGVQKLQKIYQLLQQQPQ